MSDETGPELHDRAARGEFLTQDERDVLEAWYSEQDEAELAIFRETGAISGPYSAKPTGLSAADRRVAADLKRHLAEIGPPIDFRVFGSRASGNATWESDLDIFIMAAFEVSETSKAHPLSPGTGRSMAQERRRRFCGVVGPLAAGVVVSWVCVACLGQSTWPQV